MYWSWPVSDPFWWLWKKPASPRRPSAAVTGWSSATLCCVGAFPYHQLFGFLFPKCGHGIFNMRTSLCGCVVHTAKKPSQFSVRKCWCGTGKSLTLPWLGDKPSLVSYLGFQCSAIDDSPSWSCTATGKHWCILQKLGLGHFVLQTNHENFEGKKPSCGHFVSYYMCGILWMQTNRESFGKKNQCCGH